MPRYRVSVAQGEDAGKKAYAGVVDGNTRDEAFAQAHRKYGGGISIEQAGSCIQLDDLSAKDAADAAIKIGDTVTISYLVTDIHYYGNEGEKEVLSLSRTAAPNEHSMNVPACQVEKVK